MRTLAEHRRLFPALSNKLYFNYGGQGPLPTPALEAIQNGYTYMQQQGPFSRRALDWVEEQIHHTHQALSQELGVEADTITLTESVSVGCNIVLWGLDWKAGDHLLLSDCEHPTVVATAQQLYRRFGVEVTTCSLLDTLNQGDAIAAVADHIRPQTRLVAISHILWNTGQVLPLADTMAACRRQNPDALVLVDAAQSVGVLPLNLIELDIDFYAFTGHKWLCGPDGVGGLYVHPDLRDTLQPTFVGWRGIQADTTGRPIGWKASGSRYEVATSAFPLYGGLTAAINLHQAWGSAPQRYQQIQILSQSLWEKLGQIPGIHCLRTAPPEAGLVSFQIEGQDHRKVVQQLEAQQIMVRLIAHPNCVRACVHYLTLESEVQDLAIALQSLLELNP